MDLSDAQHSHHRRQKSSEGDVALACGDVYVGLRPREVETRLSTTRSPHI